NLVGRWATWDVFRELERLGLIMYGQMTAGSWIYIGTQGILQGTYETFGAMARRHFGGSLRGRLVLTGGLGGMGGAQPLAATMNDGVCLAVEVDPGRVQRRLETRYLDRSTASLDEAVGWCEEAKRTARPVSVGLIGNCAEVLPELARRGFVPDALTDQTSAHDPLNGYVPAGLTVERAAALRRSAPAEYLHRWIRLAQERVAFQGLPARICWLGQGERAQFGCALNELVKRGEISAPVVIGRDHLDTGSVASPFRETEAMKDGSDAIADWPILNALLNTATGAAWVSWYHWCGAGLGN